MFFCVLFGALLCCCLKENFSRKERIDTVHVREGRHDALDLGAEPNLYINLKLTSLFPLVVHDTFTYAFISVSGKEYILSISTIWFGSN